jgi:hypothetical protein
VQRPTEELRSELERLAAAGERLIANNHSGPPAACQWRREVIVWLKKNLPDSGLAQQGILVNPPREPLNASSGRGLKPSDVKGMQKLLGILFSARNHIPGFGSDSFKLTPENLRRVFIVHGRDDALKGDVARFLEKIGLEVVILHEQPNQGRTIIEKFSDHSDVSFAVILLTGDDRGGLASASPDAYKLRARQNVIFELGYFVGRLGRKRVAAICGPGVELPSDYHGVVFIPQDTLGLWRTALAKELRACGLPVDLNKL